MGAVGARKRMAEGAPLGVWLAAVCALCPFLLASPWRHGFAFDDFRAVVRNADARWGAPLRDVLGDDFWGTPIRDQGSHKSYRPLATLSFQLDDALFGTAFPGGYKLHNLLWHAMVTLLAAAVLSAAGRRGSVRVVRMRRGTAVAAACLFAAHPVHCEAVMGAFWQPPARAADAARMCVWASWFADTRYRSGEKALWGAPRC